MATLLLFGGELGLPVAVPMEIVLLLIGADVVHSVPALLGALLLLTVADAAGTTLLFLAMRPGGRRLMQRFLGRHAAHGQASFDRWRRRLKVRDVGVVFVGRALPVVRMSVPIGAGFVGLGVKTYVIGATAAALVWVGTPLVSGYVFRGDVRRVAEAATRAEHALLTFLAAAGLVGAATWWVRRGGARRHRWRRGRAVLGLAAAIGAGAFLVYTAWREDIAADNGRAVLPLPLLVLWLGALGGGVLALAGVALADLRAARASWATAGTRAPMAEVVGTLAWVAVLVATGAIVLSLELLHPLR